MQIILKDSKLDLENLVESILIKSQKLVDHRNLLSEENKKLKTQISELKVIISNQESSINKLVETRKVQQMAGVIGRDEKKTSLKKIDEVVREIDHCIALLNS